MGETILWDDGGVTAMGSSSPPEAPPGVQSPKQPTGERAASSRSQATGDPRRLAEAEARTLMADRERGYFDQHHPKHKETNDKVKMLFRIAAGEVAPPDAFRYAMLERGTVPSTPQISRETAAETGQPETPEPPWIPNRPELQELANTPASPPPSLGPNDPFARVPESPAGYAVTFPRFPEGSNWDWDRQQALTMAHQFSLSSHQLQLILNRVADRAFAMKKEGERDGGLRDEHAVEITAFLKGVGVPGEPGAKLLRRLHDELFPQGRDLPPQGSAPPATSSPPAATNVWAVTSGGTPAEVPTGTRRPLTPWEAERFTQKILGVVQPARRPSASGTPPWVRR